MADFLTRHQDKIKNLGWVVRSFILTLGIAAWILLQPDLSTSIVIFVLWFALTWASGLDVRHLLLGIGAGALSLVIGLPLLLISYDPTKTDGLIKPYQIERILNFLLPDPNATYGANYNVLQALISIGLSPARRLL